MKSPNPFTGLTEAQHCKGSYARNAIGQRVPLNDSSAVRWCAIGAIHRADLTITERVLFEGWFKRETGTDLAYANDYGRLTFAQFEAAWDRWPSLAVQP